MAPCGFSRLTGPGPAVHTVVEGEGGLQAAQVLQPHPSSAAQRRHGLGFPLGRRVLGQPGILHPARGAHTGVGQQQQPQHHGITQGTRMETSSLQNASLGQSQQD